MFARDHPNLRQEVQDREYRRKERQLFVVCRTNLRKCRSVCLQKQTPNRENLQRLKPAVR